MTKYREILVAIVKKIKNISIENENITIYTKDVEEGFKRPCFFLKLDNIKVSDFMKNAKIREITVRLTYFPSHKHKNQEELLEIREQIESLFIEDNYIEVLEESKDRQQVVIEVNNSKFNESSDNIMSFQFDITLDEFYVRENNNEMMEEIHIGGEYDD